MKSSTQTLRSSLFAVAAAVALPAGLFADDDLDDRIEKSFKHSEVTRSELRETKISVDAEDGVVTLKGDVYSNDQKRLAEDTARSLPGVVSVVNKLEVKPEPKESSDDWIALKVRGSLLYHRNVSLADTDVQVMNGVVTLTGTAETAAEKALAAQYASDVKGVKSVDNKITVVSRADRERAELDRDRAHARADLDRDRARARADIDRERESLDADHDRAMARAEDAGRTTGEKFDDASITAKVKGSLAMNRSTSAMRTEVTTRNGVVTLRGEVKNSAEKELAGKIAKDISGVRDVNNELTIVNTVAGE